jgi:hypothetical protein
MGRNKSRKTKDNCQNSGAAEEGQLVQKRRQCEKAWQQNNQVPQRGQVITVRIKLINKEVEYATQPCPCVAHYFT